MHKPQPWQSSQTAILFSIQLLNTAEHLQVLGLPVFCLLMHQMCIRDRPTGGLIGNLKINNANADLSDVIIQNLSLIHI